MKYVWKFISSTWKTVKELDKDIFLSWLSSLFLNVLSWWLIVWKVLPLQDDVVLHYTIYFGVDWLGPSWYAFYIPLFGFVIMLINIILNSVWFHSEKSMSFIFTGFTLFVQLLAFCATVIVILANV